MTVGAPLGPARVQRVLFHQQFTSKPVQFASRPEDEPNDKPPSLDHEDHPSCVDSKVPDRMKIEIVTADAIDNSSNSQSKENESATPAKKVGRRISNSYRRGHFHGATAVLNILVAIIHLANPPVMIISLCFAGINSVFAYSRSKEARQKDKKDHNDKLINRNIFIVPNSLATHKNPEPSNRKTPDTPVFKPDPSKPNPEK